MVAKPSIPRIRNRASMSPCHQEVSDYNEQRQCTGVERGTDEKGEVAIVEFNEDKQ